MIAALLKKPITAPTPVKKESFRITLNPLGMSKTTDRGRNFGGDQKTRHRFTVTKRENF